MSDILQNVTDIRAKIAAAAQKSGRNPDDITLIGVTKTIDAERIKLLLNAGVTVLGENRVQEIIPKYEALKNEPQPPEWHFIGHLQKNKVKYIIDKVKIIHSVDSFSLAQEIDKQAKKAGIIMKIMVEINIANENSKFGLELGEAFGFFEKLQKLENIEVCGIMCLAPFVDNGEKNRQYFCNMRKLLLDISRKLSYYAKIQGLSMGMSGDFEVAVEEGATLVRIGTALFNARI